MTVFRLETLGIPLRCRVPAAVGERLVELLPGAVSEPWDGPADVTVAAADGGWRVTAADLPARRVADPHEAATLTEWYVTETRLRMAQARLHLHASACVTGAGAIVAAGASGSGKSALAVAWSVAGLPLLADDALIAADDGCVVGVRRTVKLATAVARHLGVVLDDTVGWSEDSPEVWFDPATAGGWADPTRAHRVAFPRWAPGAATRLRTIPRAEAVGRLMASRLASGAAGGDAFAQAAALLHGTETVELSFGDAAAAARVLAHD